MKKWADSEIKASLHGFSVLAIIRFHSFGTNVYTFKFSMKSPNSQWIQVVVMAAKTFKIQIYIGPFLITLNN